MVTEGAIPYNGTAPVRAAGPPAPRPGPARSAPALKRACATPSAVRGPRRADAGDGERGRWTPRSADAGGGARALGARRAARGAAGHAAADCRGRGRGQPRQRSGRALPGQCCRCAVLSSLPPRLRHDGRVSASAGRSENLRRVVRRSGCAARRARCARVPVGPPGRSCESCAMRAARRPRPAAVPARSPDRAASVAGGGVPSVKAPGRRAGFAGLTCASCGRSRRRRG